MAYLYLKGGDLDNELGVLKNRVKIWNISDLFSESFFETKKIVYLQFHSYSIDLINIDPHPNFPPWGKEL